MASIVLLLVLLVVGISSIPLQPRSLPISVYDYYEFLEIPKQTQTSGTESKIKFPKEDLSSSASIRNTDNKIRPSAPFRNQPPLNPTRPKTNYQTNRQYQPIDPHHRERGQQNFKPSEIVPEHTTEYRPQLNYKPKPQNSKPNQKYYHTDDVYDKKPTRQQIEAPQKFINDPVLIQQGNKYYQIEEPIYIEPERTQLTQTERDYEEKGIQYNPYIKQSKQKSQPIRYELPIQVEDQQYYKKPQHDSPKSKYNGNIDYNYDHPMYEDDIHYYDEPTVDEKPRKNIPKTAEKEQIDYYEATELDPVNYDYYYGSPEIKETRAKSNDYYGRPEIKETRTKSNDYYERPEIKETRTKSNDYYGRPEIKETRTKTDDYFRYEDDIIQKSPQKRIEKKQVPEVIKEKRQTAHQGSHFDANGQEFASQAEAVEHGRGPGRLSFQIHGQKGPHSYRFGYDTGKGDNRQFRYEERDNEGLVNGRYGFYDQGGELKVVNYSAHPKHGFSADVPKH